VRGRNQIVILNDEIADRGTRHVQPQRLPVVAVVERNVDLTFGAGEEESLALGVLANGIDGSAVGDAVDDLGPGLAAIARAEDMGPHVVEAERIDGGICGAGIEVARVEDGYFRERHEPPPPSVPPTRAPRS